jgi:regulator of sigma E protease
MVTALIVIGILVFLIVAHELGHFIAAKIFGVRVDEFGVGYPPRAFLFGKFGGTEYTLNWIPFGGFVRLYGEDVGSAHGRGSFIDAPRWKQAIILLAGVAANLLVAWLLFASALVAGVPRPVETTAPGQQAVLYVSYVVPGSPAAAGGMAAGDQILEVSDDMGARLTELTPDTVLSFVKERGGQKISISYLHGGATTTATVIPANAVVPEAAGRPAIGIGLVLVSTVSLPLKDALVEAFHNTWDVLQTVLSGLWSILSGVIHGKPNLQDVVGPVGLVGVVHDAARTGFGNVLALAGFIAVNLVVINLIPIPALDGGRLLIVIIEAVMRRDAPRLIIQVVNMIGIALIALLMITVTYQDIARLLM